MTDGLLRSRRSLLRLSALAAAGAGGCATFGAGTGADTPADESVGDDSTPAPTTGQTDAAAETAGATDASTSATATETGTGTDLDLREANVTAVAVERSDDGHRFSVTLYHDDDGEDGYANWWQVETLAGERLGRRKLLHAHGTREFTRSATVDVPGDVPCVVVRGHDRTHGYGGQAMLVTVDGGATRAVEQRSEKRSFADGDCP